MHVATFKETLSVGRDNEERQLWDTPGRGWGWSGIGVTAISYQMARFQIGTLRWKQKSSTELYMTFTTPRKGWAERSGMKLRDSQSL